MFHFLNNKNPFLTYSSRESNEAKRAWNQLDYDIIHNGFTHPQIAKIQTCYWTTYSCWTAHNEEVCWYEEEHGIDVQWAPESPKYNDVLLLSGQRKYCQAVDKLECLIVQRLFELTKLGMNGVGMP